jgi:hypothetical protein
MGRNQEREITIETVCETLPEADKASFIKRGTLTEITEGGGRADLAISYAYGTIRLGCVSSGRQSCGQRAISPASHLTRRFER